MITVCPRRSSWAMSRRAWTSSLRRWCQSAPRSRHGSSRVSIQYADTKMEGAGHCHLGSAHSPSSGQPGVLGGQVALALHPADRSGSLDQHRGQPFVAVPLTGRVCLPADSCIAGANPAHAAGALRWGIGTCPRRFRR